MPAILPSPGRRPKNGWCNSRLPNCRLDLTHSEMALPSSFLLLSLEPDQFGKNDTETDDDALVLEHWEVVL